jgi:cyclophilin family peptidyl-prolyl cis-trans isomerase
MRTLAATLVLLLAAPAIAEDQAAAPDPALLAPVKRLLELEDRRSADLAAWTPLLRSPLSEVRRRAARGAGRVRAVALGPALRAALGDETDEAVRSELVFALGLANDPASLDLLVALTQDERASVRAGAVAALARHGATVLPATLLAPLSDPDAEVRGAAALALARLRGRRAVTGAKLPPLDAPTARALLAALGRLAVDADPEVRWRAAYALADGGALDLADWGEARLRLLERLLDDPAPYVRLFAARGLGGHPGAPERRADALLHVLRGQRRRVDDPHVRAAIVAALGRVGLQGARERIAAALLEELTPGGGRAELSSHVAAAAFGALAGLGRAAPADAPAPPLRAPLAAAARAFLDGPERVHTGTTGRAAAVDALLRVGAPDAVNPLVTTLAGSASEHDRLAIVAAARWLPVADARQLLVRLRTDPSVHVQAAALDAWSGVAEVDSDAAVAARSAAIAALREPDLAVRGTAVSLLASVGQAGDLPALAAAVTASSGSDWAELRGEAAKTALAWAKLDATTKPAVATWLQALLKDEALAVRAAAATALAELEGTTPPPAPADDSTSTVQVEPGVDLLLARPNPRAVLHTSRGDVLLELLREEAPRHVKSFVALAKAGRCDGLPLHRVVTGFVVQGLDPRGDGWGAGGVRLRDELNQVPFLRGAVGMPSSGPDTGGCQLFITHVPTPHLDGGYTVFARVVAGLDVVDVLDVGDVVQRVELLTDE